MSHSSSGAHSSVVIPMRSSAQLLGRTSRQLPADLSVVCEWPDRVALVVGSPAPQLVATLERTGFSCVVASKEDAASTARAIAPFAFMILGIDVFDDDDSVEQVRAWHRCSPSARVKLATPGETPVPQVLVRAVRAGVTDVIDGTDQIGVEQALRSGLARAGAVRERVLAIGAHPDDVEIGCGGTLLDHRRRGDRISILTLSQGAVGGDQLARLGEAAATADSIGAQLIFGNLPDTEIDSGIATIRLIESVVAAVDPTVVYVHSAHDNHQDHRAVSTAVRSATRGVRRVFAYQSPSASDQFTPSQFVSIDAVLRRKVEVLQMFRSQDGRSYLEPELVVAGARYWARHLGANARYAEPFEVIRSVGELRHWVTAPDLEADPQLFVVPPTQLSVSAVPVTISAAQSGGDRSMAASRGAGS